MLRTALLPLLLLTVRVESQSGDTEEDAESRISCSSHIAIQWNSVTCRLLPGRHGDEDDEDNEEEEEDAIDRMSLCSWLRNGRRHHSCVEVVGNTLNISDPPVGNFTLSAHLRRGGQIQTTLDLKKIVKPKPPQVCNVHFDLESNQAVVRIQDPYQQDYLTGNQMFQLHIWNAATQIVQNLSSETWLKINMEHLRTNTRYGVKVRGHPVKHLQGSWSEWSRTYSFETPAGPKEMDPQGLLYIPLLCLVPLVVVMVTAACLWRKKIFPDEWLSIPRPKDTLVHICKPHRGLLLNLSPEVFSALKVTPMLPRRAQPEPPPGPGQPASAQSSDCRSAASASTEELELSSALMSSGSSSSDAELSLHGDGPAPVPNHRPGGGAEVSSGGGAGQQEEAYVTMSSFYQVK